MPTTKNTSPKSKANARETSAAGHIIQTGNQTQKIAKSISNKIRIHRRGRDSGRSH